MFIFLDCMAVGTALGPCLHCSWLDDMQTVHATVEYSRREY